jgi:NAD(P)-dependent dehydrogenase (short-subunit alcohol dehydrogenase family)
MSMQRDGARKVALVTGAFGGIGRPCAERLVKAGFRVFGTSRQPVAASEAGNIEPCQLDVTSDVSVRNCVAELMQKAGRIDVLVNNSGVVLQIGAVEETLPGDAKELFEINLFGAMRMCRAVLPHMRAQGRGRIINVGSLGGFSPMPFQATYCASKHALRGLTLALDHEVRRLGIRASVVEPGFVHTEIGDHALGRADRQTVYEDDRRKALDAVQQALANGMSSDDVARVVVSAATTWLPRTRYKAGWQSIGAALACNFLPSRVFDWGVRKTFNLD